MLTKSQIRIRDPFVFADKQAGIYYLYGTTDLKEGLAAGNSFSAYTSRDLEHFEGPFEVFCGDWCNFWADKDFWAPEVHFYGGKYYLFGSFKRLGARRGTQILVANSPLGPFAPLTDLPVTPADWDCLDGTLFVENGTPYVVFCHEWTQIENGEICAMQLSDDLKRAVGEPIVLFRASDNPCVHSFPAAEGKNCRVTDGPFLYYEGGKLNMIWSSFINREYCVLQAQAESLLGEWTHLPTPKLKCDGGHAMLFTDFHGKRKISLHRPNTPPLERAVFLDFDD